MGTATDGRAVAVDRRATSLLRADAGAAEYARGTVYTLAVCSFSGERHLGGGPCMIQRSGSRPSPSWDQ